MVERMARLSREATPLEDQADEERTGLDFWSGQVNKTY
jgi:hypothetical protein